MPDGLSRLLAENIRPAPGRRGWHGGPTPPGALRGVSAAVARWRPAPGRKSIWELALHIAYWKYAVRRKLEDGEGARFRRSPANWPALPDPADALAWSRDVALLRDEHERLATAVLGIPPRRLGRKPPGGRQWTYGELIVGIAQHDAYHTGQIQLVKRLWQAR